MNKFVRQLGIISKLNGDPDLQPVYDFEPLLIYDEFDSR